MLTLGLDLSLTHAGWAVVDPIGWQDPDRTTRVVLAHGVVERGIVDKDNFTEQTERMVRVAKILAGVVALFPDRLHRIAYEGPTYSKFGRIFHLGGMHFVVQAELLAVAPSMEHIVIGPTETRRHVFGQGRHPKTFKNVKEWVKANMLALKLHTGNEHSDDAVVTALAAYLIRDVAGSLRLPLSNGSSPASKGRRKRAKKQAS